MNLTERKWLLVTPPQLLTSNGNQAGEVSVSDISLFRVKQKVVLKSLTQEDTIDLEIKRIIYPYKMIIGKIGDIGLKENLSAFLTTDLATIEAIEQPRPSIDPTNVLRSAYEEEPLMSFRTSLIDKYGQRFDESNRLPVDAVLNVGSVEFPTISNFEMTDMNTEYSFALPANTKKFRFKARKNSIIHWSFVENTTDTNYLTLLPGNTFVEEGVTLPSSILYFRANKDNEILEILSWT